MVVVNICESRFVRSMVYISGQEISKCQNMGRNTLGPLDSAGVCGRMRKQGVRSDNTVGVLYATLKSSHLSLG